MSLKQCKFWSKSRTTFLDTAFESWDTIFLNEKFWSALSQHILPKWSNTSCVWYARFSNKLVQHDDAVVNTCWPACYGMINSQTMVSKISNAVSDVLITYNFKKLWFFENCHVFAYSNNSWKINWFLSSIYFEQNIVQ